MYYNKSVQANFRIIAAVWAQYGKSGKINGASQEPFHFEFHATLIYGVAQESKYVELAVVALRTVVPIGDKEGIFTSTF